MTVLASFKSISSIRSKASSIRFVKDFLTHLFSPLEPDVKRLIMTLSVLILSKFSKHFCPTSHFSHPKTSSAQGLRVISFSANTQARKFTKNSKLSLVANVTFFSAKLLKIAILSKIIGFKSPTEYRRFCHFISSKSS